MALFALVLAVLALLVLPFLFFPLDALAAGLAAGTSGAVVGAVTAVLLTRYFVVLDRVREHYNRNHTDLNNPPRKSLVEKLTWRMMKEQVGAAISRQYETPLKDQGLRMLDCEQPWAIEPPIGRQTDSSRLPVIFQMLAHAGSGGTAIASEQCPSAVGAELGQDSRNP